MAKKETKAVELKVAPVNKEERVKLDLRSGDTIRVWQKIKEKDKFRLQAFEGVILSRKHGNEAGATFTVRATIDGVGMERTFPLYSPMIEKIDFVRRSKVRRAKLYHIRKKAAHLPHARTRMTIRIKPLRVNSVGNHYHLLPRESMTNCVIKTHMRIYDNDIGTLR